MRDFNEMEKHYSRITTLVEGSTSYIDLSESEAELLEKECEFADKLHEEYLDSCMDIGFGNLNELSMHDLKDKGRKAWDAIVDFFKRAIQYIQKKIRGQMDNLSLEREEENGENYIMFYAKAKRIKKFRYEPTDKMTIIDVEEAYTQLKSILTAVDSGLEAKLKEATEGHPDDYNNETDGTQQGTGTGKKEDTGNIYRDFLTKVKKKDQKADNSTIDSYIKKVNQYYQKAIDIIHKVGKSAIKNAKKSPTRDKYKKYVAAKSLSAMCLNINTLFKIQND